MNPYPTASYANGRPYTPLRARLASSAFGLQSSAYLPEPSVALTASLDWAAFWQHISSELLARHYTEGTRAQYRTILRNFYRHARGLPAATNEALIHAYLVKLTEAHYSWNWVGMNISVLRTVFDKLAGRDLTRHLTTPKRNFPLPEVLSQEAVRDLLAAATSTRDQLILGLLYGCGLKVGELRTLTWADIDAAVTTLRVRYGRNRQRNLEIPPDLQPVLAYGKERCRQADFIFQGRTPGTALSARMIELIVRQARHAAGILNPVTAMTLRHAYGVHCLESGDSVRDVQQALGHQSVKTTMLYTRCMLAEGLVSPLDLLRAKQRQADSPEPDTTPVAPPPPARPHQHLFTEPPSVEALELPFRDETTGCFSRFQNLIKTHILGRFLCHRRATIRDG